MMRLLITGATGFIGKHLLSQIAGKSVNVIVLVRDAHSAKAIKNAYPAIELIVADIASSQGTSLYERCGKPDALIHLAWGGLPNYNSLHHIETELPAHYQFISDLVRDGVNTVMVAGTCFEYGMQQGCLDETLPTQPSNPYGFAKDCLRKQLEFLKQSSPFNLIWPRFFYTFGVGQSSTSLYAQLMLAIECQDKVFNMSGGEQLRDYLPVSEVVQYLFDLILLQRDVGLVNICSGEPISVRRFVERILQDHRAEIKLNLGYYPYPSHEPMAFWGDTRKLHTLISNSH
jgi:nucleoside-diphosphate-sugar epimerase